MLRSRLIRHRGHLITLADQGSSTISNFALAVAVARTVSPSGFGQFAIVVSIYWFVLGSFRALIGEPLLIFRTSLRGTIGRDPEPAFHAAGLIGGLVPSVVLAPFLLVPQLQAIGVLGLCIPVLLWQDTLRFVFFARGRPELALAADAGWVAIQAGLTWAAFAYGHPGVDAWLALWTSACLLAGVVVATVCHELPSLRDVRAIMREVRATSAQMLGDFVVTQGGQQLIILALPAVASLTLLGALKAAQIAMGPLNVTSNAILIVSLPMLARLAIDGNLRLALRRAAQISAGAFALGVVYGGALLVMPKQWGHVAFGASWANATPLVAFVAAQYALIGVNLGAQSLLRATKNSGKVLSLRVFVVPITIALPLVGAAAGKAEGLGLGVMISAAFATAIWWWFAVRTLRRSPEWPNSPPDVTSATGQHEVVREA